MKIVYLAAGRAGMYCGSCLHDNTLAAALIDAGHDVLLTPTYTPIRTDEPDVSQHRLFFGGINVFLQQHSAIFRHTPWMLDKLLDSPALINLATGNRGPTIEAEKLGDLTVSMLAGEAGHQSKELDKLVAWLGSDARPQIVHLSNSMLVGMAEPIRKLGVPVVCTLSGEDLFLEKLPQPHYDQLRRLLAEQAQHVDAFVAMNDYYADFMSDYLSVPRERVHRISHGLNLSGHGTRKTANDGTRTIGYFARICPEKGLHLLISAFEKLMADPIHTNVQLRAGGYLSELDKPYFAKIQERVRSWPNPKRFEYVGEVTREQKIALMQTFDVMSVPTVYRESKGISVLEALANAVPVVLPAHGAFPELIADTGGGVRHEPNNVDDLAAKLHDVLTNPQQASEMGTRGQQAIYDRYTAAEMANRTAQLYANLI